MLLGFLFEEDIELLFVLFSHVSKVLVIDLSLFFVAVKFVFVHSDFAFQVEFVLLPDSHEIEFGFFLNVVYFLFHACDFVHEGLVFDVELADLLVGVSVLGCEGFGLSFHFFFDGFEGGLMVFDLVFVHEDLLVEECD